MDQDVETHPHLANDQHTWPFLKTPDSGHEKSLAEERRRFASLTLLFDETRLVRFFAVLRVAAFDLLSTSKVYARLFTLHDWCVPKRSCGGCGSQSLRTGYGF